MGAPARPPHGGPHMIRLVVFASLTLLLAGPAWAERIPRCDFGPGALPVETAPGRPHGSQIPIDTIVVMMQENRSFDHYFGQIHFEGQRHARRVPRNASNPEPTNPSGAP